MVKSWPPDQEVQCVIPCFAMGTSGQLFQLRFCDLILFVHALSYTVFGGGPFILWAASQLSLFLYEFYTPPSPNTEQSAKLTETKEYFSFKLMLSSVWFRITEVTWFSLYSTKPISCLSTIFSHVALYLPHQNKILKNLRGIRNNFMIQE